MYALIVSALIALGGTPFPGLVVGDDPTMHHYCVDATHVVVCADGFTI